MAENSTIEWTDATWNPITGCSMVSAGCTNCYAMGLAATRLKNHPSRAGLTRRTGGRDVWTGEVRFNEQWLDQPLRWKRPRKIFVCAHGDLFHESVPDEWIDRVFGVMGESPQHTFQVLTKRPERMALYLQQRRAEDALQPQISNGLLGFHPFNRHFLPPAWVWLGTSVEDQATADQRIPHLLSTPAAVRFLSMEPLLGPVSIAPWVTLAGRPPRLDWVIVGGESGPGARPMHPDWARSLQDQCVEAGVPFFFKQHGSWLHDTQTDPSQWDTEDAENRGLLYGWPDHSWSIRVRKADAGRDLDGRTWDEVPRA